ncbi:MULTISPECIES: helix-turn-helix domain-containing/SEL1-like repeat protein [unclassified Streptomyces]|uniref:helix-turn-helix domain-containing/SEL1-like repeat protein n=1 Tax=unclassified Streptomyces TaxID=2593676 RepID=UPI001F268FA6|nr:MULTISPECIES: helix-turn-helix domain-containing/SEL1-like repeat protein [unclassified Streptomyces]MCF0086465.1 hypothetical protein [Streptomyces sp. MH192]MCF0098083.1 hypothetical protein [Streptomyces sp. MH191]
MGGEPEEREAALAELRKRLEDALAREGLTKVQLAARTRLGRTTVQEAFRPGGRVPSALTVAALSGKLGLPDEQLLELRRAAAGESGPVSLRDEGLGKEIGQWDPHDLEVHPAGTPTVTASSSVRAQRALPGYVRRAHDQVLAEAVGEAMEGRSRMLVLVGSSSTGKTRACWEVVQPLAAAGWRLWHPYDPTRAEAALADLDRVTPRTVVWLNEAQHYLGHLQAGERIAAALHTLLTQADRVPVLVLGTLWSEYADAYTALPQIGKPDPHSRVRELLTGRTLTIPDTFDEEALRAASALAQGGDRFMKDALTRAHTHGRVTQDLAGAPELVRRYEHGTPPVKALLQVAMDARRFGVGLHLPQAFLIDAATDYLTDDDYDQLVEDWAETAFADLARPVHGKQAPLRRTSTRHPCLPTTAKTPVPEPGLVFRLADYLEQHGRTTRRTLCPPASFWHAAHKHLVRPDDLANLAAAAEDRYRLQWTHHLRLRAAEAGNAKALLYVAKLRAAAGDAEGAAAIYGQVSQTVYRQVAEAGDTRALHDLAQFLGEIGHLSGARAFYQQAADAGDTDALISLAQMREHEGDWEGAEVVFRQAAAVGSSRALIYLGRMHTKTGDTESAKSVFQQAADSGNAEALLCLAGTYETSGDLEGAKALYRQAAEAGVAGALTDMACAMSEAGDAQGAEAVLREAASGDGGGRALFCLAELRARSGDVEGAEVIYREAADAGDVDAQLVLAARLLAGPGGRAAAEDLLRPAADAGFPRVLFYLAEMRMETGNREGAEAAYRQTADAGCLETGRVLQFIEGKPQFEPERYWPYGLNPDGAPATPWQACATG